MGTKPIDLAVALDIERQSLYRLVKNWWTISLGELEIIADTIGVTTSQLRFPPPTKDHPARVSLDELIEDIPEEMQQAAVLAVRGIAGKPR